jgi:hypothetical protein
LLQSGSKRRKKKSLVYIRYPRQFAAPYPEETPMVVSKSKVGMRKRNKKWRRLDLYNEKRHNS